LAFVLTIANVFAGIVPAILFILLFLYDGIHIAHFDTLLFGIKILLSFVSFVFCSYIVLDIIFGFSLFSKTRKMHSYKLNTRYGKLCGEVFNAIKLLFNIPKANLLILESAEEKVYTIASMNRSFICITTGMLDSINIKSQNPEEFCELLKAMLARKAIFLAEGDYLSQAIFEMNGSVTKVVKWVNSLFFNIIGKILGIIPVVGVFFAKICYFFNKIIELLFDGVNFVLLLIYRFFTIILTSKDEKYYDTKAAEALGGEIVAKALSFTQKADYKIFSTSANIHKRIKKVAKIVKKEHFTISDSMQKGTVSFMIIMLFVSFAFFAYEVKIWKVYDFFGKILQNH